MPAPTIADVEAQIMLVLRAIPGLEDSLDFEPQNLPRRLPTATILFTGGAPSDTETGSGEDVEYAWRLNLYIPLDDFENAQIDLKELLPEVFAAFRSIPTAAGLVDFLRVADAGEDPVFAIPDQESGGAGYLRKSFRVTAVWTEH